MTEYFPRELGAAVARALKTMPVVVITGMRQTGKTTFLRFDASVAARDYVSFDDFAYLQAAKADPDGFVDRAGPLSIDEAHKCPDIFDAIKRAVDHDRQPGRFLLSGSANFAVLRSITESLAGRAIYLDLHPFNRREISGQTAREPFLKQFFREPHIPPLGPWILWSPMRWCSAACRACA